MIFKYYPHKFANVEAASGISQEELDFVKTFYGGSIVVAADQETGGSSSTKRSSTETKIADSVFRYDSYDDSSVVVVNQSRYYESKSETTTINVTGANVSKEQEQEKSTVNKFWTEGEEVAAKALSLIPISVPRQEILACSMTA